uniref:Uncharacterized protein n=1 Tax=Zonotrichia albicollis TaxID=44394 RepID=A0A8D2MWA8_ZONAL
ECAGNHLCQVLFPVFFLFWLILMSMVFLAGFGPPTALAWDIMRKVASDNFEDGLITEEYLSEEELEQASLLKPSNFVGVVFKDSLSYQLRFHDSIAMSSIYTESRGKPAGNKLQNHPQISFFWLKTNHSVWEQLDLTRAMVMGEAAVVEIDNFPRAIILIYLVIAFSPFGYYLAIHIVAEKERKLKEFLKILGLHDTAFWYVSVCYNLFLRKEKKIKYM